MTEDFRRSANPFSRNLSGAPSLETRSTRPRPHAWERCAARSSVASSLELAPEVVLAPQVQRTVGAPSTRRARPATRSKEALVNHGARDWRNRPDARSDLRRSSASDQDPLPGGDMLEVARARRSRYRRRRSQKAGNHRARSPCSGNPCGTPGIVRARAPPPTHRAAFSETALDDAILTLTTQSYSPASDTGSGEIRIIHCRSATVTLHRRRPGGARRMIASGAHAPVPTMRTRSDEGSPASSEKRISTPRRCVARA